MDDGGVRIERPIDLPRLIVWDALVDPVLVTGWLHPWRTLREGARVVRELRPELLDVDSPRFGRVAIALGEVLEGTRGSSTSVVVSLVPPDPGADRVEIAACWHQRLDQLAALLRGHPVDWSNWDRDHGADYRLHLERERHRA